MRRPQPAPVPPGGERGTSTTLPGDSNRSRRTFLTTSVVGLAALAVGGCTMTAERRPTMGPDVVPRGTEAGGGHGTGRLSARPGTPTVPGRPTGLQPLGLAQERDALLYVPSQVSPETPAPMVVLLHGAGGTAEGGLAPLQHLADERGLVLLAPASRGRTWDVILGDYGPDVAFVDRALEEAMARQAVDPGRLAVGGFSDGASYALSIGLVNGDLFGHVVAFSPGFVVPGPTAGSPRVFVSHGTADDVLPIGATSRRIVPRLEAEGYDVRYREFEGGHVVPPEVAREALDWFLAPGG